jgi:hypothetical protein
MSVADTSKEAYANAERLTEYRKRIVAMVEAHDGKLCNLDLADLLHLPINAISGQVNWLVKNDYLELDHKAPSRQTGFRSKFWKIKPEEEGVKRDGEGNPTLFGAAEITPATARKARNFDRPYAH